MSKSARFSYLSMKQSASPTALMPYFPLKLSRGIEKTEVFGLLDSGAAVNVLPFQIGLKLGAVWENQMSLFQLGGNLGNYESKGLILTTEIVGFEPVKLAFA